jgi:uncharacterized membrane protein
MARRTRPDPISDSPESTAKDPNPAAAGLMASEDEDTLIGRTVTINRPARELYEFWRDLRNLPLFMENIESITVIDARRSHWKVKGPADSSVEWDSVITDDIPGELIAWESAEGTSVPNSGALGKMFAKMFQREPKIQARRDLRRFKQLMETGEISTSAPVEVFP